MLQWDTLDGLKILYNKKLLSNTYGNSIPKK